MIIRRFRVCSVVVLLGVLFPSLSGHAHELEHGTQTAIADADSIETLIAAFRETGDDHFLDDAWRRLSSTLPNARPDAATLVLAATVAQARHDFEHADRLIDRALDVRPYLDQAWLLRASIELVRGRTQAAADACRQLRKVSLHVTLACRARVDIASGETDVALRSMTAVVGVMSATAANADLNAWFLSIAGDAAAASEPAQAIRFYERSLAHRENTQVRAALVDQLIASDRWLAARRALDAGHDALPLRIRRFIVATKQGDLDRLSADVARADRLFQRWIERQDWAHAREMTRFYIDVVARPELARRLARINLGIQKEPEDLLLARRVAGQH